MTIASKTEPRQRNAPVDLARFDNRDFDRGAGRLKEAAWILVSALLFRLCPFSFSRFKCLILRLFGARIGANVVIKPQVKITFPWKLELGSNVWLGEESWLLNLERIRIGDNVCISQRAFLCTGSHDYKQPAFDLIVKPILVEDGAWLCADSWVGPGVTVGTHAVLSAGGVATKDLEAWGIYQGNPAIRTKERAVATVGTSPRAAKEPVRKDR